MNADKPMKSELESMEPWARTYPWIEEHSERYRRSSAFIGGSIAFPPHHTPP
jgi:hypothetical protein